MWQYWPRTLFKSSENRFNQFRLVQCFKFRQKRPAIKDQTVINNHTDWFNRFSDDFFSLSVRFSFQPF